MRRLAAAAVLAVLTLADSRAVSDTRPNVLVLVMDTTRADRCSFEGYDRPTTPRLDEFAKDAVVFREAWSPAPWTGPAHASLFTGMRCEHHGFYKGNSLVLRDTFPTLAERLAAAGWTTGCFTNNSMISPGFGLTRGFDRYEPLFEEQDRPYPYAAATHAAAAAWAIAQAREGRPFFLFVNDTEPHLTYTPPEDDAVRFLSGAPATSAVLEARAFDFPRTMAYSCGVEALSELQIGILSDLYDAEIHALDREIGVLLDRLRDAGLLDSTIVVVAGDHGENLGDHHLTSHGFDLHRSVLHIPLLVRWPGSFDGGGTVDALVRLEDVAPTILELCGVRATALDGMPLTRSLAGRMATAMQGADVPTQLRIESSVPGADARALTTSMSSVFDGRFHLISRGDGRCELYDVTADPAERQDVSATRPDVLGRLLTLLPRLR